MEILPDLSPWPGLSPKFVSASMTNFVIWSDLSVTNRQIDVPLTICLNELFKMIEKLASTVNYG
jgi:hypothetical protein